MKRKVLFALWLVTWILVCCTAFSFKIEELMTARVVTVERPSFGAAVLPLETALRDETGWHLYYTYEGAGWESGTRVAELFDGVVISSKVGYVKPEREIYEALLRKYDLKAEECFFVDDTPLNVVGAMRCGMDGAVFHGDMEELRLHMREAGIYI